MSAADLGAQATARPWTTTPVARWRVAAIDLHAGTERSVADCSVNRADHNAEADAAFIVYAANNIERVEAEASRLRALLDTLVEAQDYPYQPTNNPEAIEAWRKAWNYLHPVAQHAAESKP